MNVSDAWSICMSSAQSSNIEKSPRNVNKIFGKIFQIKLLAQSGKIFILIQ